MKRTQKLIIALNLIILFVLPAIVTAQEPTVEPEELCGSDDRVASMEKRMGRIFYGSTHVCTVWLTSTGALLTAGHCAVHLQAANSVIEFNVPASTLDGTPQAGNKKDRYPIRQTSIIFSDAGLGNDWAVFGVDNNADTQLSPYQAQAGFFRITRQTPAINSMIRVTGFGTDDGAQNRTNQTHTGSYLGESANTHEYQVDTTGGNSGSPIIWESNGFTIGIHTNAGCDTLPMRAT